MIIGEYFYCTADCSENACALIEKEKVFSVDNKFNIITADKVTDDYTIVFSSSYGTLKEFVRDIYLIFDQLLPVMNDEVTVVYHYQGQCNLEFEPDLLKMISDMNLHLLITCYEEKEEENRIQGIKGGLIEGKKGLRGC